MEDVKRCKRCHWPIVPDGEAGCWESNCSMRPMPPLPDQAARMAVDAVATTKCTHPCRWCSAALSHVDSGIYICDRCSANETAFGGS